LNTGEVVTVEPAAEGPLHPIGVVERRTGIPGHVLRAWERRYGIVSPDRTDAGHRLYSEAEVERLEVLGRLVDRGYRVGRLARLSEAQRLELLGAGPSSAADRRRRPDPAADLDRCKAAVREMDGEALGAVLQRVASTTTPMRFMTELVAPLLRWVGDSWSNGTLTEAHEHLCSEVVGRQLAARVEAVSGAAEGPRLLVSTLSGERHYLGGLLAALTGATAGWKTTWLGPDLPAHAIATAARQLDAGAVAVSFVAPGDVGVEGLDLQIAELRALLPGSVALYIGGAGLPPAHEPAVGGVRTPESLQALHDRLQEDIPAVGAG
jgi:DNA-binding transcriptional MerR regulator